MSATLHMECDDCKVSMWVGQEDYIYGPSHHYLVEFVVNHKDHRLVLRDSLKSCFMDGQDGWTDEETWLESQSSYAGPGLYK